MSLTKRVTAIENMSLVMRPSLWGRIKFAPCLSARSMPPIFSKKESH